MMMDATDDGIDVKHMYTHTDPLNKKRRKMANQMGRELQQTHVCNNVHCNEHERNEHGDHHQKHPLMQITEGKKKAKNALAAEKSTCTFCTHIIKSITSYKRGTVHKLAGKRCALDILSLDAVRVSVMSIIS